ncbi:MULTISPECIES: lipid A deacylase LpxR family protein [unclassified Lentimicrobium]|uniref:lipid A deacylase LpxR family protein n=1 Tax=unclassified Lentimicrobium TaxID=2677434 RepID=UPI00155397E4|nr:MULTISPECIES: lipid A deacylase LpxR family protein [unclassified Lentimicrobium]NPD44676.1 lipid A deacylase LpxR family protein [Lentimicrobium sp. S6]NPD86491.1 lipid A deacylase LpxR family protein [Lentimicrobium sp. L6]
MQRKIIISLLFIILFILLWRSCEPDQKHPQEAPQIPMVETPPKFYIQESGIYLLNKNWEEIPLDSLLRTEPHIELLPSHFKEIIFITSQGDSIQFSIEKIYSKEPIIFFNRNKAPFLSNRKGYNKSRSFFFSDLVQNKDTYILEKTHHVSQTVIDEKTPIKAEERILFAYESIKSKTIGSLDIPTIKRSLEKKQELELADRSLYYPLLNYNQFIELGFDNDFWDYTDYYYTNGVYLSYSHPFFVESPLSYLLVSNGKSGIDYYGITLVQNMYTGIQPKVDSIVPDDRPWAAYTMLGQNLISFDSKNKMQHYSEINFGVVGPYSGGGFIQDLVHTILPNNSPPQGWHNQINTDYIIDYQYKLRSLLYENYQFESYLIAGAQIGTLRDNLKWGFGGKYGSFIPFYQDITAYNRKRLSPTFPRKIRFNFLIEIETQLIGYDATLQGGVTDRRSVYVIPPGQINRFVIEGTGGLVLSYGRFELQFIQHWKSKEFRTGKDHKYVSVRLKTAF